MKLTFWKSIQILVLGCLFALPTVGRSETSKPISVQAPGQGFVSLGIYDDKGKLIRSLAYAKPVTPGTQTFAWDGTTDLGLPASPGSYHARGVWFPEQPKINYAMKIGISGNPPYVTNDDRGAWGGNLGAPQDVATNGKNIFAIFGCVESDKTTGIQLMDMEGNIVRRFTSFFGWDIRHACAIDDKNAYVAISARDNKHLFIGKYDLDKPPRGKILCDIPAGDHFKTEGLRKGEWKTDVRGLALSNGRLYVPVMLDDKLFVVDAESGKILNTVSIPSPRGIAAGNGKIYLLSGKNLITLDPDGKPIGSPIISNLDDPSSLALDAEGNFYVSDRGASQQVKVFTPEGKPLREIGLLGGRPRNGIYDPKGLLDPRGLCVTPDGRVWVASSADDFQELTAWNKAGAREKAFYNIQISSGLGRLSPDNDEMLAGYRDLNDGPGVTAYKIDWTNKTWAPSWHLEMPEAEMLHSDVFLGNDHVFGYIKRSYPRDPYLGIQDGLVKADNGKTYLVGGDFSIWLFDPATKQKKLASLVWTHRAGKTANGPYEGYFDNGPNNWLTWSDLNDDGKMSLEEVNFTENVDLLPNVFRFRGWKLQSDLSILLLAGENIANASFAPGAWNLYKLPPHKVLPSGVPVYDWNDLTKVVTLNVPDFKGGDGGYKDPNRANIDFIQIANDSIYVNVNPISKTKLHLGGIDGDGWWASRNLRMSPMKFDLKTGDPAWLKLGNRAPGLAKPGQMYYPGWGLAGSVNGIDYYADTFSQVWAWTDSGLYLGPLYDAGKNFTPNRLAVELIGSFVYKINGKTYILSGDHGVYVHEVVEPKLTPIDGGTIELTPAMAAAAKPWDPDGPLPGKKPTYIARTIFDFDKNVQKNVRTITVDGKLDPAEWDGVSKMDIDLDGKKVGTVQVTFDKTNLYLAYDIEDSNGLKNDGHELPYAPFVSGSYVDFSIGPDWGAPNRTDNIEGDVRVILARITGASPMDYQMAFWPIKKELRKYQPTSKINPQTVVSPAQQRHFDDVAAVPGLTFAYQVTEKGYTLEAQVPFAALGINPSRQAVVGSSVAFADKAGQVRNRASHWAGESEAMVVDRPGSAELKPASWGTLQFDRTPLPGPTNVSTN
jgi:FlgD Ig-like domain